MATKNSNIKEEPKKWERSYDYEDVIVIWRYDAKISTFNPYEVEVIYKEEQETKKRKTNKTNL